MDALAPHVLNVVQDAVWQEFVRITVCRFVIQMQPAARLWLVPPDLLAVIPEVQPIRQLVQPAFVNNLQNQRIRQRFGVASFFVKINLCLILRFKLPAKPDKFF
jgi:hypothetical protein